MVETRHPLFGPRRRQRFEQESTRDNTPQAVEQPVQSRSPIRPNYAGRPRPYFKDARQATVEQVSNVQPENQPVTQNTKQVRNESFLEAFIKLVNSLLRLKGK